MLLPVYRLADRAGRVCVKLGLRAGEATLQTLERVSQRLWQTSTPVARLKTTAAQVSTRLKPLHLPRSLPALGALVLFNLVVFLGASWLIENGRRDTEAAASLASTPLAQNVSTPGIVSNTNRDTVSVQTTPGLAITPLPNPLSGGGVIIYAYRRSGWTNLWALSLGQPQPVRLTAGPWDDRDPALSPDGAQLAFASRRLGGWNLFVLDLRTGETRQLTTGPDFKASPVWSPDGQFIAFEWYHNLNFDVAIISAKGGNVLWSTSDPAADYEPAWSPAGNGREIVWVSMRNGNPDLWRMSLDDPVESAYAALTHTPDVQETGPAFSPDGRWVVYADAASPQRLVYIHSATDSNGEAIKVAQGQHPAWSPDGASILTVVPQENGQDYLSATPLGQNTIPIIAYQSPGGRLTGTHWSPLALPEKLPQSIVQAGAVAEAPLWAERLTGARQGASDPPYSFVVITPTVTAPDARLSDRVDEAFSGLRRTTAQATGWDFLATLDNALVPLRAPPPPSMQADTWLKTGRAFDITQAAEQAHWVVVTREDLGFQTYWRVWVRVLSQQNGVLGEPLRRPPWDLSARYSGTPQPYDTGGEYARTLPPGYFVDFTTLAEDFGWTRIPAQNNWISFYPGVLYWRFEQRGGLDWLTAMREVYTAQEAATQTPVPSPTSTPTVTNTPTDTATPTKTATPTRWPTRTPSKTPTRWPSRTPSKTPTRWPTLTPTSTPTPRGTWYTATPTVTPTPTETEYLTSP